MSCTWHPLFHPSYWHRCCLLDAPPQAFKSYYDAGVPRRVQRLKYLVPLLDPAGLCTDISPSPLTCLPLLPCPPPHFQAFKSYDEAGVPRRVQCLKYLVLANMLMESKVDPFDAQEAKPYKQVGEGGSGQAVPIAFRVCMERGQLADQVQGGPL